MKKFVLMLVLAIALAASFHLGAYGSRLTVGGPIKLDGGGIAPHVSIISDSRTGAEFFIVWHNDHISVTQIKTVEGR